MITIVKYNPSKNPSGVLQGTFSINVEKFGNLEIRNMSYFQKGSQKWITFPSKDYEKDGQKKYFPFLHFKEAKTMDAFSKKVLEALEMYLHNNKPMIEPKFEQMEFPL